MSKECAEQSVPAFRNNVLFGHPVLTEDEEKQVRVGAIVSKKMTTYAKASMQLLMKLGSIAVHAQEMLSDDGHAFDRVALKQLLDDVEVKDWIAEMTKMALLPVKRKDGG